MAGIRSHTELGVTLTNRFPKRQLMSGFLLLQFSVYVAPRVSDRR